MQVDVHDIEAAAERLNETLTSSLPEHSRNKPQNNVVELHPGNSETP